MKTLILTMSVAAALFGADRPAARQKVQQQRIVQGARSGQLTPAETRKLEMKERALHREIVRDRIDGGGLTLAERAKIEAKQDRLSREIAREKHDAQHR